MWNLQKEGKTTGDGSVIIMLTGDICPACGGSYFSLIGRDLQRCRKCRSVFNAGYSLPEYDENYFMDEYRNQYGKTYIDDFHHIYKISTARIKNILSLMGNPVNTSKFYLLDIGSAAGFFLKSASDYGIGNVEGIEISGYAADYCIREFGIEVINDSFDNVVLNKKFNIVTAWYFIEHIKDPVSVMENIYSNLVPGGVFAFSVPSLYGPMFYFNRKEWIDSHPSDHMVDFHPAAMRALLRKTGFKKIMIKPAGFHPERVLSRNSIFHSIFRRVYKVISGMICFSDTMEVYAVK